MIKLYRKNQLGIGEWRIWSEVHDSSNATLFYCHASVVGGSMVHHHDHITLNQSGRNIHEQVQLEMNSRISRQRDKGYKDSIDEAKAGVTNQMGFINPMLAHPIERVGEPKDFRNAYIQRKYDGHRTLITNFDGDIVAYTRKGKSIETIGHILNEMPWLPPGVTLDGELYIHGKSLQTISSIIKRQQADNKLLHFHWYDIHDSARPGLTYSRRLDFMTSLVEAYPVASGEHAKYGIVETFPVSSMAEAWAYFRRFRAEKYEGAMLRLDNKPYQDSIRSSSLIKLKWEDGREECEVTVTGVRPSRTGWAICECKMDSGKTFDTSAPGSEPEKMHVMNNPDKYIGRRLTIEYSSLTDDGIPFHAVATRWHEEL